MNDAITDTLRQQVRRLDTRLRASEEARRTKAPGWNEYTVLEEMYNAAMREEPPSENTMLRAAIAMGLDDG